jgi:hypothetical protein
MLLAGLLPCSAIADDPASDAGMPRYSMPENDEAVARANARLNYEEHNYALARQAGDKARVDYCRRAVQQAHRQLTDALHGLQR